MILYAHASALPAHVDTNYPDVVVIYMFRDPPMRALHQHLVPGQLHGDTRFFVTTPGIGYGLRSRALATSLPT